MNRLERRIIEEARRTKRRIEAKMAVEEPHVGPPYGSAEYAFAAALVALADERERLSKWKHHAEMVRWSEDLATELRIHPAEHAEDAARTIEALFADGAEVWLWATAEKSGTGYTRAQAEVRSILGDKP